MHRLCKFLSSKVLSRKVLLCKALLFFVFLLPAISWSNGWADESEYFKSGNLKLTSNATLVSESVRFILDTKTFDTEVTYHISARNQPVKTDLIFPILCINLRLDVADTDQNKAVDRCVTDYQLHLNGRLLPSSRIIKSNTALSTFEKAYQLKVYDEKVIDRHFPKQGIFLGGPGDETNIVLFKTPIETNTDDIKISIKYTTPYYYNESGYTKSSFYYYSNDIVYYDFSPANTWSPSNLDTLKVTIEPRNIQGPIVLPDDWSFKKVGNEYHSEIKNISLKNKHLVFGINQQAYKQYLSHTGELDRYAKISYTLTSDDSLTDNSGSYSANLANDGNTDTAWCSAKDQPEIEMQITAKDPSGSIVGCYIEGVGVLNGYTKNAAVWQANSRIQSSSITFNNTNEYVFTVLNNSTSSVSENTAFYPYTKTVHFSDRSSDTRLDEKPAKPPKRIRSSEHANIRIKFLNSIAGDKYKEICVSEIYPIYNCP